MALALGARQHLLNIVEASDEAWAQIESSRPEGLPPALRDLDGVETGAQHIVEDAFQ
jgi:hypothetical protein